jgi:hypothetical protein
LGIPAAEVWWAQSGMTQMLIQANTRLPKKAPLVRKNKQVQSHPRVVDCQ